ncbi:MAG: ferrochelatase [Flavobacteriales bacterium]|jgi:ferrochelatase|tara:strand:+ start:2727 stop:3731 length:1005 start_codon:yes stop_codon:yes gene_type:complete
MKGLLLINLGSPDSTDVKDVKKYLAEFLMDERVIGKSYLFRLFLVKGIILNFRPKKSAAAYKKIWWDEGSPLIVLSQRLFDKVKNLVDMPSALAMRYGSMSIKKGIQELHDQGVDEITVLPLYPHYAMSSYESVVVKVEQDISKHFSHISTNVIPAFYNDPLYKQAMINNVKHHLKGIDYDYMLFSYHGLPESHLKISDPTNFHCQGNNCCNKGSVAHTTCYRHQVFETTKDIVKGLGLKEGTYSNAFQSRLANEPWLKPYTDSELERLAKEGIKKVVVITPAFVTDCLETLEEIAMEAKEEFMEAGGEEFHYIPCLNDNDEWAEVISKWSKQY